MSDSDNNSEYSFKEDINNDTLIKEVQKRPPLYDRTVKEFNDAPAKKKLWQDICGIVFKKWSTYTKTQQYSAEIELLKRWKNLRGCYAREIKTQRNPDKYKKRRRYIYYDKLKFLDPFLEANMRCSQGQSYYNDDSNPQNENIKIEYSIENDDDDSESFIEERFIEVDPNMLDSPKVTEYVTTSSDGQKRKRKNSEESDPDTHFALSLVPMLASLPMSRKISAQIEILQTLKKMNENS